MNLEDTIAAISTPPGEGGIGIIRISGPDAIPIASRIFRSDSRRNLLSKKSHTILYGFIINPKNSETIDEVLLSVMRSPRTYTREDIVEINCHGGMLPLRKVLETVIKEGARLARPGEFTFRAFMNGRIDLSQAEATIDLIRSKTERSQRLAFEQLSGVLSERITSITDALTGICAHIEAYIDFPEEEIEPAAGGELLKRMEAVDSELLSLSLSYEEARFFREGLSVAIVGRPNVGKSSLLNALLARERAIVTELPGTTRDVIEEYLNINGLPIRIMDTAGIRNAHDLVETEGVKRSLQAIEWADIVLAVFDLASGIKDEDMMVLQKIKDRRHIIVLNKSDLKHRLDMGIFSVGTLMPHSSSNGREETGNGKIYYQGTVIISAKTGDGIDSLKEKVCSAVLKSGVSTEGVFITNLRHKTAIDGAIRSLRNASQALRESSPYEIVAFELRDSLNRLGEISGKVTTEDVLERIFSEFCIGK